MLSFSIIYVKELDTSFGVDDKCCEELTFDQIVDGKSILAVTKEGFIKIVSPENCKLADVNAYFYRPGPKVIDENVLLS